jgi:predicted SAM-dependent methyltransferase
MGSIQRLDKSDNPRRSSRLPNQTLETVMKRLLAPPADAIWPRSLSRQVKFETMIFAKFALAKFTAGTQFRGKKGLRVNVGCGFNVADGYVNIDVVSRHPKVVFWDCRKSMPFDNASVEVIFAEHIFEHLEYPAQSSTFLKECHRCLEKGGVVRIVVPDGGLYLPLYDSPSWEEMARIRPLVACEGGYRDHWLGTIYRTKMEFINAIFRQGIEHKFIYDFQTLELSMKECGFGTVQRQEYGISASRHSPLDSYARRTESLYVEGVK